MKIKSGDVYIINELQRNPSQSIRFLAKNLKIKKDKVFRALKKFRKHFRLEESYQVNYSKIGLKPFTVLVECRYLKADKVIAALKNPYLLELYKCIGGEALYILAKYAAPLNFHIKPALGLMKSWNWIKESYITYIKSEGYNISFHYFDYLTQEWRIKWLYWGLMIKDVLINRDISGLFPKMNMIAYDDEKESRNLNILKNIRFLIRLVSNPRTPVNRLAETYNFNKHIFYDLKKFFTENNVIKKLYRIDWRAAGLNERIAVIVKTENDNILKSILQGFLTLPECSFYTLKGELNGIIFLLSLPYGGLGKIHSVFTEYLFDKVDSYWLLPVFEEEKINFIPPLTLLDEKLFWKSIPVLKDRRIILYGD